MSLRKQQQVTAKSGALVPASMPAAMRPAIDPDRVSIPLAARMIVAARSVFLTQLVNQYETNGAAAARRLENRAIAADCYDEKLRQPALRHLLWA